MKDDLLSRTFLCRSEDWQTACGQCRTERYTLIDLYANVSIELRKAFFNS